MKRDLTRLADTAFDVLVVGGGIYGAFVAWDAALRGYSVALIEMGDFGGATSANSLKIIHGGLRYLQDGDLRLVRAMAAERRTWLQIAPHLVRPLPCLLPATTRPARHRLTLSVALAVNELAGRMSGPHANTEEDLPPGKIITREECFRLVPGLDPEGVTGGAIWHDAQIVSSERLLLSVIHSAVESGAVVANYVKGTGFLTIEGKVIGLEAQDVLTGERFDVRAALTVNATGGWSASLLDGLGLRPAPWAYSLSTAMNLVTRQIIPDIALGCTSRYLDHNGRQRSRVLFMVPWRNHSLIGTVHSPFPGRPEDFVIRESDVQSFIDEINNAYPDAQLGREDIYRVHGGFLPAQNGHSADVRLVRENVIIDHEREDGLAGLVSLIGVKYTTARIGAEKALDLAGRKLGRDARCRTRAMPLRGGRVESFSAFVQGAERELSTRLDPTTVRHLAHHYGTDLTRITRYLDEQSGWAEPLDDRSPTIAAEVIHAVREEMAVRLCDVIRRRTELGAAGAPGRETLRACAELMAAELGWSESRTQSELDEATLGFPPAEHAPLFQFASGR